MRKKIVSAVLTGIFLICGPAAAVAQSSTQFSDIQGIPEQSEIQAVCDLGLLSGRGGQDKAVFSPLAPVTKSELAVALQQTFHLDYGKIQFIKEPQASDYYQDVDNQAWYADAAMMCAINQIFDENLDESPAIQQFNPGRNVERLEVAQAVYRSFNAKGISVPTVMVLPQYKDTEGLSQDAMNAVAFVSNTGILKGEGETFRPHAGLNRGELAQVILRCMNLMRVDENENGKEYQIAPGSTFVLSLAANPSTGYEWSVSSPSDSQALVLVGKTYVKAPADGTQQSAVGQGGRQYWRFKAVGTGKVNLALTYARAWESVQPAKTFHMTVDIETAAQEGTLSIGTKELKSQAENMAVDMKIPVIQGLGNEAVQSEWNRAWEKEAMDFEQSVEAELQEYVKESQEAGYPVNPFGAYSDYAVHSLNNGVLSLCIDYYQYTGGAHGMTDRKDYNIDLNTGKQIALKDWFEDGYDYKTVINREISRQIAADPELYFSGSEGFKGIADEPLYYIEDGNLVIYFGLYEIAPYAAGFPEFRIPFSSLSGARHLTF